MPSNRKKNANPIAVGSLARWIVVAVFLCAAGLSYVYLKNQLHSTGRQIEQLERELAEINTQNEVMRTRISTLSSRSVLQKRLNEGFIKMMPIAETHIVRLNGSQRPTAAATGEVRTVVNRGDDR